MSPTRYRRAVLELLRSGETVIDLVRRTVRRGEQEHRLTATEARLLAYLAERPGRTVSQEELLREVWGYREGVRSRAVAHAVGRLRHKIEAEPSAPVLLLTVYGEGFRLELAAASTPQPGEAPETPPAPGPVVGLPARRPGFRGRGPELQRLVAAWKEGASLLTLWGPGGMGKTRLATEFAHRLALVHPPAEGGVIFVPLAQERRLEGVVAALAAGLGLAGGGLHGEGASRRLGAALAARGRTLVVLDNLEQVEDALAPFLLALVERAPGATVLLTTRRPRELPGATRIALPPLSGDEAVALLVAEARRVHPLWPGEAAEVDALRDAARQLDHLPLALELAAPRLPLLGPRGLAEALRARGRVLRRRGRSGRHAGMEAAIAWSWDLLTAGEREVLRQCAVFEGAFELGDAQEVVRLGEEGAGELEGCVEALVGQSLVRSLEEPGRLGLFSTIRAFVRERAPLDAEVRARHVAWARRHARAAVARSRCSAEVLPAPGARLADLRAAGAHAREAGLVEEALVLAACLDHLEAGRSTLDERRRRLEATLEATGRAPAELQAACRRALADLLRQLGELDAAEVQLDAARTGAVSRELAARVALTEGALAHQAGRLEVAAAAYERALATFEAEGIADGAGMVHTNLGLLRESQGRIEDAAAHLGRAVELLAATGLHRVRAIALVNLATLCAQRGQPGAARGHARAALALAREVGLPEREASARLTLGNLALARGEHAEAAGQFGEAARRARAFGDRRHHVLGGINQAAALLLDDALDEAEDALRDVLPLAEGGLADLALGCRGVLRRLQGFESEAAEDLARACVRSTGREGWRVLAWAHLAAARADSGSLAEAAEAAATASELAEHLDHAEGREVLDLCLGHLDLARAREREPGARERAAARLAAHPAPRGNAAVAWRLLRRALDT